MTEGNSSAIGKILHYQLLIIAMVAVGFSITRDTGAALSSILGGLAAFIPNLYFVFRIHKSLGQGARKILNSFYIGESGKLLLTAMLFIIIFQFPNLEIFPLLTGYVTALSVFWFALLMR